MKLVVLVAGAMRSGKDTLADALAEELRNRGVSVLRTAFAESLKASVALMLGVPVAALNNDEKDTRLAYGKALRYWLRYIGTEVGRQTIADTIWVDRLADRAKAAVEDVVIVSDARFINELDMAPARFGERHVIRVLVTRPSIVSDDPHPSEAELRAMAKIPDSYFDLTVINNHTLDEFKRCAREGLAEFVSLRLAALQDARTASPIPHPKRSG